MGCAFAYVTPMRLYNYMMYKHPLDNAIPNTGLDLFLPLYYNLHALHRYSQFSIQISNHPHPPRPPLSPPTADQMGMPRPPKGSFFFNSKIHENIYDK